MPSRGDGVVSSTLDVAIATAHLPLHSARQRQMCRIMPVIRITISQNAPHHSGEHERSHAKCTHPLASSSSGSGASSGMGRSSEGRREVLPCEMYDTIELVRGFIADVFDGTTGLVSSPRARVSRTDVCTGSVKDVADTGGWGRSDTHGPPRSRSGTNANFASEYGVVPLHTGGLGAALLNIFLLQIFFSVSSLSLQPS